MLLIFNLYPTSIASVRLSGQRLQADAVADSVIEEYMARPFSQLAVAPPLALPQVEGRGTIYHPEVEVFAVDDPQLDATLIRGLRVKVRWNDRGADREIAREVLRTNVRR